VNLPIPIELLALPPLALAAGVDLYLTLLFIGAAPTTGLWAGPLPGALGDLDSPGVLIMVGSFYLLEFAAERFPPAALAWNAFHAIIRPVSGVLLALLLLDGQPLPFVVAGALVGGALASIAHGIRSGAAVLRWLGAGARPSTLLVSLAEDALVLGIVALTLDAPAWAAMVSLFGLLLVGRSAPSLVRAFAYAIQLAIGLLFRYIRWRGWHRAERLPSWVGTAFAHEDQFGSAGALRGTPVGAWKLPGAPRFAVGWVVARNGTPVFVHRRGGRGMRIDLGRLATTGISEQVLFRRVDLHAGGVGAFILFGPRGPGIESLRSEFTSDELP
jgi:hypothetical protein